jgi:hypothetical protein
MSMLCLCFACPCVCVRVCVHMRASVLLRENEKLCACGMHACAGVGMLQWSVRQTQIDLSHLNLRAACTWRVLEEM